MLSKIRVRRDEGFTLVELLIAIVILGLSVSVLVLAMSSLVVASQEQRGHTVSDQAARNFSEAMQQKWSWVTTLSADVAASGAVTLSLNDPISNFQTTTFPFDVLVDQEIMKVTGGSGNSLTVTSGNRGAAGSTAAAHSSGASVSQDFICPTATFASSPANHAGYLFPDGFTQPSNATVSIGEVDYWNQTSDTFTSANDTSTCLGNYSTGNVGCPDSSTFLPECDPGLIRVKVHVATSLTNLRNVTTDTWVLLRRWSN